jgi:hypothetical protein
MLLRAMLHFLDKKTNLSFAGGKITSVREGMKARRCVSILNLKKFKT